MTFLTTEINTWKKKFLELEDDLINSEKELAKADKELAELKKKEQ